MNPLLKGLAVSSLHWPDLHVTVTTGEFISSQNKIERGTHLNVGIRHSAFLLKISSLLIKGVFSCPFGGLWGQGGAINIWPVNPFETVLVINGYTNKM